MRSPESTQSGELDFKRDPDGILGQFEGSILKLLEKLKEKNLSHADKKKVVRMVCLKNGGKLGLPAEHAQNAAMYFFRLIDENRDEIHLLWKNLHELSLLLQNEQNEEWSNKIIEKLEQLFALNKGGLTFFWRLIHAVVRGDLDVQEVVINNDSIYYITIPDEKTRRKRNTDKERQKISGSIKDQLRDIIIEKPLPELPESLKLFSEQDQAYLRKIIIFLQQDADLLVLSSEWKKIIQKYFDDVAGFLENSISKITLEKNRSDARKVRYAEYVNHILTGYLAKLLEYCLKMADPNEENIFAADTLLEPSLVSTNVLQNGTDEPNIIVIVKRWQKLMRDIQSIVGDNATRFNIPILNTPENPAEPKDDGVLETGVQGLDPGEFTVKPASSPSLKATAFYHPALSGEIPSVVTPVSVLAQTHDDAMTATRLGRPAIESPVPAAAVDPVVDAKKIRDELLEWSEEINLSPLGKVVPQGPRGNVTRRKPNIDGTILGLKAIDGVPGTQAPFKDVENPKRVDPFAATMAVNIAELYTKPVPQPKQPQFAPNYMEFFDSLYGPERQKCEEYIKNIIGKEIAELKKQILDGTLDLKSKSMTYLLNKLQVEIFMKHVLSDNLRIYFTSKCCQLFNDLNSPRNLIGNEKEPDKLTKEYIYSTLTVLFGGILNHIKIPEETKEFLDTNPSGLADNDTIISFRNLPRPSSYKLLSQSLSEDDPVLVEMKNYAINAANHLANFAYFFESLGKIAEGGDDKTVEFKNYYSSLKEEYELMQSMIKVLQKKISGGFFKRLFGNKELKSEIKEYFTKLSDQIEWIWQAGIEPSMQIYGKIILGKHRRQIPARKV